MDRLSLLLMLFFGVSPAFAAPHRSSNETKRYACGRSRMTEPQIAARTLVDTGSDGSFILPANLDQNLGPISLFVISADFPPKGNWQWNASMMHPTTGTVLSEDINLFVVQ